MILLTKRSLLFKQAFALLSISLLFFVSLTPFAYAETVQPKPFPPTSKTAVPLTPSKLIALQMEAYIQTQPEDLQAPLRKELAKIASLVGEASPLEQYKENAAERVTREIERVSMKNQLAQFIESGQMEGPALPSARYAQWEKGLRVVLQCLQNNVYYNFRTSPCANLKAGKDAKEPDAQDVLAGNLALTNPVVMALKKEYDELVVKKKIKAPYTSVQFDNELLKLTLDEDNIRIIAGQGSDSRLSDVRLEVYDIILNRYKPYASTPVDLAL